MKKYDVIIVGAGPSGIFAAYELLKDNAKLKILMLEKGRSIKQRSCPKRETGICLNCQPCNIVTGFSGAGAFSDGKLSLDKQGEIGGNLRCFLEQDEFADVLKYTDDIYLQFGADQKTFGLDKCAELEKIRKKTIR